MDEETLIKRRIEAIVTQAQMNANAHGGDAANAAMDIMCAFVLLTSQCGTDLGPAKLAAWDHAKAIVDDFWPNEKPN